MSINGGGSSAGFMDNTNGNFIVEESDKTGRDHRSTSKGRTQYVGEHYLRFAGTNPENPNGDWFVKAGADALVIGTFLEKGGSIKKLEKIAKAIQRSK